MAIKLFGNRVIIGKQVELEQYAGRTDDAFAYVQQNLLRYGTDYTSRNRLEAYRNIVYACVSLIAEACGDYEPRILRPDGTGDYEETDHEFLRLLDNPSGNQENAESFSRFDLIEATISYQLLQGDCFWYIARGVTTGRPREIVVLRPDKVGTDVDPKTGKINGYFIRQSVGDPIPLEVNEVLRFNLFNPIDPYKGYGPVEANSAYIETDESTSEFTKNFFKNNAGLSGVLNLKGEVTKGAFRKFVRGWRDKYQGVDNAGKVAILRDSDASFTKVGLGLNELDMAALRNMTIKDVLRGFKVPLPLLGEAEQTGLGRANIEGLEYIFAKYNIDKKLKRLDKVLQFALNRYYPEDKGLVFTHENIIPEDKEFELKERTELTDKVFTRNEARKDEGLDPVDGGDQLFVAVNQVSVGSVADPMNEPDVDSEDEGESDKEAKGSGIKVKLITPKKKDLTHKGHSDNERFRLSLMRTQSNYEKIYRRVLKPIWRAQKRDVLFNLEAHSSNFAKAHDQKLFDDAEYDAKIVNKLQPVLTDLSQEAGSLAMVFAGDTENEFYLTAPILNSLRKGTQKMATNFNDETLDRLNRTLAEGIQNGEGIDKLKGRVEDVYQGIDGYRSERIARTETLKAGNNATVWGYKQTGYVTGKAWSVNPDACPQCEGFDGKTVPLDDAFLELGQTYNYTDENGDEQTATNSYDTVEEPPLHPNCRCTIIPVR